MPEPGEVLGGRYALEQRLGEGAMGEVWLARHVTLGSPVAIKMIRPEAARYDRSLARFEREGRILAKMSSAHIVKVLDHGHHDGLPYIVMEYLQGESLYDRLRTRGRLSVHETGMVVTQVCRALSQAHALGLVHRDIKPANIFFTRSEVDGSERVKVLDFGVAKSADTIIGGGFAPTQTGTLLGTPYYLSPEQAQGRTSVDYRADLWSLAVVAFECLTGQRPFQAPSVGALLAVIVNGPIPLPSQVAPDLPAGLDGWVRRGLSRYRDGRFNSALEMADAYLAAAGASDSRTGGSGEYQPASTVLLDSQGGGHVLPIPAPPPARGRAPAAARDPAAVGATVPLPAPHGATGAHSAAPMAVRHAHPVVATPPAAPAYAPPPVEIPVKSRVGLVVAALVVMAVAGAAGAWWAAQRRASPEAAQETTADRDVVAEGADAEPTAAPPAEATAAAASVAGTAEPVPVDTAQPEAPSDPAPAPSGRRPDPPPRPQPPARPSPAPTSSGFTHRREL